MTADTFTDFSVHSAPTQNGGTEIAIFGELDAATEAQVTPVVDAALERTGPVVIDLRACPFVDSRGIGVLVRAAVRLQKQDRTLVLRGVQKRVRRILDITGLATSDLLAIEPRPEVGARKSRPATD